MIKPKIIEHNATTNEIIERVMTDEEFADFENQRIEQERLKLEEEAKAAARQAILDRLGLTEKEAKLLLG